MLLYWQYYKVAENKQKETNIENRTCFCFDDIIKINDLDLEKIILDENSYKIQLIYLVENLQVV